MRFTGDFNQDVDMQVEQVGAPEEGECLVIACRSYDKGLDKAYTNIAVKKIPQMLLDRCEFGKDDYSLNIAHPSAYEDEEVEDDE